MLKRLQDADIAGKRILLRTAYDITLQEEGGKYIVPNDARIRATIPTITYLLDRGCSLVINGGWIQRPMPGVIEEKYKMNPIAKRLSKLIGKPVRKLDTSVGKEVDEAVSRLKPGEIVLLENTRFNKGETEADPVLARQMAGAGEFVVFDAFGHAMRVHASTTGILDCHKQTCAAGFLMEKELTVFESIMRTPQKPFVLLLGGAKVSDKSGLMYNILDKVDVILVGGALANPFLKAAGYGVGDSLVESVYVDQAKNKRFDAVEVAIELLARTADVSVPMSTSTPLKKIQLPRDVVIAKKLTDGTFDAGSKRIHVCGTEKQLCDDDEAILDIGPETVKLYSEALAAAKTVFWNGPMGLFENPHFSDGTKAIAQALAGVEAFTVAGGGDTEGVIDLYKIESALDHVSTGGGAALNLLAGEELPVLKYLQY